MPQPHSAQQALSITATLCKEGRIDDAIFSIERLIQQKLPISSDMVYSVIQACFQKKDLASARRIYYLINDVGLGHITFLKDNLLRLFALCGSLHEAYNVFSSVLLPTIYTWNSMISAFSQCGEDLKALALYEDMNRARAFPDKVTFLAIIKACSSIGSPIAGKIAHKEMLKHGIRMDLNIANTLLAMYGKCWNLMEARSIFDRMPTKDVVSWSAMIAGYAALEDGHTALMLFERMQSDGMEPNMLTFSSVMKACGHVGHVDYGFLIHDKFLKTKIKSDLVLGSTLVDMYNRLGSTRDARKVFDDLQDPDIVAWGAMFLGYSVEEDSVGTLELYQKMEHQDMKPNRPILLCVIKACGNVKAVNKAKLVHNQTIISGLESDLSIGSTLTDMYVKCGILKEACKVFKGLQNPDAVIWGAMVAGYAANGDFESACQCLEDMQQCGLRPTETAFTSILTACSHAGLVEPGYRYFQMMNEVHGVVPTKEHLGCMVDLLGRAGRLKDAEAMLSTMCYCPDTICWRSLLTFCKTYNNLEIGRSCFEEVRMLEPRDASAYVLMSGMYAHNNMWEEVDYVENLRKCAGAEKMPGVAWIEVGSKVHEFVVSNERQLQSHWVVAKFCRMARAVKSNVGFVPQSDSIFNILKDFEAATYE